jgi:P27 family predicted phage terminase small subunit
LPLPSSIKAARGTLRPCRVAANEAKAAGKPRAPKDFTKDQKKEFNRLAKLLGGMGLVGEADGNALERYVRTWLRWRQAEQMIQKTGDVLPVKDSEGRVKFKRSPYVDIAATLAAQLDKLEQAFGLTPSARSRIEVAPAPAESNDKARFFAMRVAQ